MRVLLLIAVLLAWPAYALPTPALLAAADSPPLHENTGPVGGGTGGGSGSGPILKKAAPNVGFSCLPEKCTCEGAAQCLDLGRSGLCRAAVTCTGDSCTCERTNPERIVPEPTSPASH